MTVINVALYWSIVEQFKRKYLAVYFKVLLYIDFWLLVLK